MIEKFLLEVALFLMAYAKHALRNSIILGAAVGFFTMLGVGWIMREPLWTLTALALIGSFAIGGAFVGALVGLLFVKLIYPQLGSDSRRLVVDRLQAALAEKKKK